MRNRYEGIRASVLLSSVPIRLGVPKNTKNTQRGRVKRGIILLVIGGLNLDLQWSGAG